MRRPSHGGRCGIDSLARAVDEGPTALREQHRRGIDLGEPACGSNSFGCEVSPAALRIGPSSRSQRERETRTWIPDDLSSLHKVSDAVVVRPCAGSIVAGCKAMPPPCTSTSAPASPSSLRECGRSVCREGIVRPRCSSIVMRRQYYLDCNSTSFSTAFGCSLS